MRLAWPQQHKVRLAAGQQSFVPAPSWSRQGSATMGAVGCAQTQRRAWRFPVQWRLSTREGVQLCLCSLDLAHLSAQQAGEQRTPVLSPASASSPPQPYPPPFLLAGLARGRSAPCPRPADPTRPPDSQPASPQRHTHSQLNSRLLLAATPHPPGLPLPHRRIVAQFNIPWHGFAAGLPRHNHAPQLSLPGNPNCRRQDEGGPHLERAAWGGEAEGRDLPNKVTPSPPPLLAAKRWGDSMWCVLRRTQADGNTALPLPMRWCT